MEQKYLRSNSVNFNCFFKEISSTYLTHWPVFAVILTSRMRDIHQEIIAIFEVALRQPKGHGDYSITVKLYVAATGPFFILRGAFFMHDIRIRRRSSKTNAAKPPRNATAESFIAVK